MTKSIKQILENIKADADKALAGLEKKVKKVNLYRFVPEHRAEYWYITEDGEIRWRINTGWPFDNFRILTGNCYRTEEQAVRARDIINRIVALRGDWLPDWGDCEQANYYPCKDHEDGDWEVQATWRFEAGEIHMPTEQAAQTLADEFGDDLLLVMRRL